MTMEYVEKRQPSARRTRSRTATVAPAEPDHPVAEEAPSMTEEPMTEEPMDDDELLGAPTRRRPNLLGLLGAALVALVVAALVLSILEWTGANRRYSSENSLRASALQAASTYGAYLSSYDYSNLNGPTAPWTEVDQHSTPSFRKDFDATKANLTTLVNDYKATAKGKVIAAGLSSVSSTQAVALLFIDQTVTNTAQKPGTSTQPLRVQLVMVRQHGHWLINKLQVPS